MKELEKHKPIEEKVIKEQPAPNKTVRFVGRMKVHKGHSMWKLDTKTMEITKQEDFEVKLRKGKTVKTLTRVGDRYCYMLALNKKNAKRKFIKKGHVFPD